MLDGQIPESNQGSPWGIASGAEDSGKYPRFNPLLEEAGVSWIRYFAEWKSIQPAEGEWDWEWSDKFVANSNQHGMTVAGVFLYFAHWASADGKGSRAFPIKDIRHWREYVRATAGRYQKEVRYWEVWNEMNSPAFNKNGTTRDYAELVKVAYEEVKAIDPGIKVGLTVAAHDVRWLDQVIRDGAAGHFDYVCVHPYNSIGLVQGSEQSFLKLRGSVRKMLDSNGQRQDIEIWMSEIGLTTTTEPEALARQAEVLTKTYVLGIAQGFEKVCWFEAVGGKYGDGVHSIMTSDMEPFPAYHALKATSGALGRRPVYQGWLNLGGNTLGFVFESPETGASLAIWSHAATTVVFDAEVTVADITGNSVKLAAKQPLEVNTVPQFVTNLPAGLLATARENKARDYPWVPNFSGAETVSVKLGPVNESSGLRQGNIDPRPDGTTIPGTFEGAGYRSTDRANKRPFMYFEVDRSFMDWGDADCEITMTARRADPGVPVRIRLVYESRTGYHEFGKPRHWQGVNLELLPEPDAHVPPEPWDLPEGEAWQTKTWRINDANFIGKWGWNFQVNVEDSTGDVWVKEVQVRKLAPQK